MNSDVCLSLSGSDTGCARKKLWALAGVVTIHAIVIGALAFVRSETRRAEVIPLQVVSVSAPQKAAPPTVSLPVPTPIVPTLHIPAPEIEVAMTPSEGITVITAQPDSAPATSDLDAPALVSRVEYIREPRAKYPPTARALKQRGTVTLRALIDTQGHARRIDVFRTSGYKLLDEAACRAVAEALFRPYMENGEPRAVFVLIPIEFDTV